MAKGKAMIPDGALFDEAVRLLGEHGDDAVLEAALAADEMLEEGDMEGYRRWTLVLRALEEIARTELQNNEAVH